MSLTIEDIAVIRRMLREELATASRAAAPCPLPGRLTMEQFAWCLQVHVEVARRYVRQNKHAIRAKKYVSRERPYRLHPAALELFGVTSDIAAARLALFAARPSPLSIEPPLATAA